MENNKSQPLWDNTDTPKNLRLPNASSSILLNANNRAEPFLGINSRLHPSRPELANNTRQGGTPTQQETPVFKSRLSADAPEFYPSYMTQPAPSSQSSAIQNRLKKHKVNEVFKLPTGPALDDEFVGSADDVRLQHLIDTLTKDPGQFRDLHEIFMDTIAPYFDNILVLSRAAQLLVEQAIRFPSFRYSAARLCCFIESYCPEFRAELHLTCKRELERTANKSGLLLFVAELYMQLHHENIYGGYLIDAFKHLLAIGGNDNVKSICQALKLTGSSLEKYNKRALDEVFVKLQEIKPAVTGTALSLITSVASLRNSQWGQTSPSNSSYGYEPENNSYWDDSQKTSFYSSDGSQFSREESQFLAENMNSTEEYLTDVSDPDELCDPEPEMDEEIQAAFRDFVKLSKR